MHIFKQFLFSFFNVLHCMSENVYCMVIFLEVLTYLIMNFIISPLFVFDLVIIELTDFLFLLSNKSNMKNDTFKTDFESYLKMNS